MTPSAQPVPRVAIACGGTGGHFFPGLAVAEVLVSRGCRVMLLVSPKEVDQRLVKQAPELDISTLPAAGLQRGGGLAFVRGFTCSYRTVRTIFRSRPPQAVLAMGGFTSAPPILAGKRIGAQTFLHESNTIPGRANRWLSWVVDQAFVGFPSAAARLHNRHVSVSGTPVRSQFRTSDPASCRAALGLDPSRPVLLIMGGSQGASAVNDLVVRSLALLANRAPRLQCLHLAGPGDAEKVTQAYAALALRAVVHPFFPKMELALGAATAAVCRAGASSLAELAAMRVPSVLVPYPAATDNHQFHNARAFEAAGAARLLEQKNATPETLAHLLRDLLEKPVVREKMQTSLAQWHVPQAAERIADAMLRAMGIPAPALHPAEPALAVTPDPSVETPRSESRAPGSSLDCRFQGPQAMPGTQDCAAFRREPEVVA